MENNGELLPVSAITPELLNEVADLFVKEEAGKTIASNPPEWWESYKVIFHKAMATGNMGDAVIPSVMHHFKTIGIEFAPAMVAKLLVVGWRMASLYLEKNITKEVQ